MKLSTIATAAAAAALLVAGISATTQADPIQPHAQLSTTYDQHDGGVVSYDSVDSIAGATFDGTDTLTVNEGGLWLVVAAPQVGNIQNNGSGSANFWIAVNGVDVANSNVTWQSNGKSGDVIISQGAVVLAAGDEITVEWSTTGPSLEAITTTGEPLTPSIIATFALLG